MVNKKGLIKILEAVIAIMIIAGAIIAIRISQEPARVKNIAESISPILDEVAKDQEYRDAILENPLNNQPRTITEENYPELYNFIDSKIPDNLDFEVKLCPPTETCGLDEFHENVFAGERIISSNLEVYSPKKIKLFIWQK